MLIMRNVYSLLLWLVLATACQTADSPSDFDRFTGRWSLHVVEEQQDSTAAWLPRQDHYKNRQGFILYDGLGGMGVHHVTDGYENYTFEGRGSIDSLTQNDLRHLANNFVYFGQYRVIDSQRIIEHHIESANNPRMWGTVAKRQYLFTDDTLTLLPITERYPRIRLKWVKWNNE